MPYRCAKFERNLFMERMFLVGSKLLSVKWCKEEEGKGEENRAIFRNTYLVNCSPDFF